MLTSSAKAVLRRVPPGTEPTKPMRIMKNMSRIWNRKTSALSRVAARVFLGLAAGMMSAPLVCLGQGTLTIGFELPPALPPGTGETVETYAESGLQFRLVGPTVPWDGVMRYASGYRPFPDNGSTYLIGGQATTNSLGFHFLNGWVFDLLSVDLAEYLSHTDLTTVQFIGYRHDGSVAVADFTTEASMTGPGHWRISRRFISARRSPA